MDPSNLFLPKKRDISLVNKSTSVGIVPENAFESITILWQKKGKMVRTIKRIYFVSKHNSRIEIYCLHKTRYLRSLNKPNSVGIESAIVLLSVKNFGDKTRS